MSTQEETKLEFGGKQKTLKSYIVGFFLSFILTAAAFVLVYKKSFDNSVLYVVLSVLAVVQLIVQSTCFLRLNSTSEGRWNLLPFLFTLLIIAILVSGSLWIMYHLDHNLALPELS